VSAYTPNDPRSLLLVFGLAAVCFLAGYALPRLHSVVLARSLAWSIAAAGVFAVDKVTTAEPAGFRMVAIVVVLFTAMKGVVHVEDSADGSRPLQPLEWATFALGWPGMQPDIFRKERRLVSPDERFRDETRRILRHGLVCAGAGSICLYTAHRLSSRSELSAALLALVGLSLVLHFGIFDVVTWYWRSRGVPCRPPFRQPLRSTSLAEFWGRRWNVPYVEMIATVLYRPLAGTTSRPIARFTSFAVSGLLHELAISLPVRAGWGGPLLYFALQGFFVLAEERSPAWKRAPAPVRRVVTLLLVTLPAPLLFHLPFVKGVIEPIVGWIPSGSTTPP